MRRTTTHVLVVLLIVCTAIAFLQGSIVLGSGRQYGDSPRTTQIVRSYYASLNSFLAGGDKEATPFLNTGDPDRADLGDDALVLEAVRATYPNLQLRPGEVYGAADLALSQVTAVGGAANLPDWINGGAAPAFPSSIDSLRIEHGTVVNRLSSARIPVLAQTVAGEGVDFRLDQPSHLKAAELVLSSSSPGSAFVSVAGPGFVLPVDGAFGVTGNGLLRASNPSNGTNRSIQVGEKTIFSGESVLVIPRGRAVLSPIGEAPVRAMLLAMVPTQPEPRYAEGRVDPRGPETLEDVLRRLTVEDPSEGIWFGSLQMLASAPGEVQPGLLSMDITRLFVPTGEAVRLSSRSYQIIALLRTEDAWSALGLLDTVNSTNALWKLETVRVCWNGAGKSPHRTCTG